MVISLLALDAYAVSSHSIRVEHFRCIDAHVNLVVLHPDQALVLGLLLIDVVDKTVGRVCNSLDIELA